LVLLLGANAQSKRTIERATEATEYINKVMKFDDTNKSFLYEALLNSFDNTAKKVKGLEKEQRKIVYKDAKKLLDKSLFEKFSKGEVKQITTLLREYKKSAKKKK
jgi:hypothetical protein